jgi:hypothetical protein
VQSAVRRGEKISVQYKSLVYIKVMRNPSKKYLAWQIGQHMQKTAYTTACFYHAELVYIQFDLMQMGTQQRTDTEKACNAVSNT